MNQVMVDVNRYRSRSGAFTQHHRLDYYSVTVDREVLHNDRKEARLLINENIKKGVNFDLALGLDTFKHKKEMLDNEPSLHPLCAWAVGMPGDTVDEVFGGADFACWRGTLKMIAFSLFDTSKAWTVVAQKFAGVILISEQGKTYAEKNLATYSGYKFEQYDNKFFKVVPKLMQCEIVGIDTIVTGFKKGKITNGEAVVYKVEEKKVEKVKTDQKYTESISNCYAFLCDVLSNMTDFLARNEVCEASYDPTCRVRGQRVVTMKSISRREAKAAGNGVTDEFITRFGL